MKFGFLNEFRPKTETKMNELKMATSYYLCSCNELYLENMILIIYDNEIHVYIHRNV